MVGAYLQSNRIVRCKQLIEDAAKRNLNTNERCEVRDSLALQILLTNAKRAGDLRHLRRDDVMEAVAEGGQDTETQRHRTQRFLCMNTKKPGVARSVLSGSPAPSSLTSLWRPNAEEPYLILNTSGTYITPSVMSKIVNKEWSRFAEELGKELPRLSASLHRKLAVTTIREMGSTREEQQTLAKQMAHRVETADRYYDRSLQTGQRHEVLDKIIGKYMSSCAEPSQAKVTAAVPSGSRGRISSKERERNLVELAMEQSRMECTEGVLTRSGRKRKVEEQERGDVGSSKEAKSTEQEGVLTRSGRKRKAAGQGEAEHGERPRVAQKN